MTIGIFVSNQLKDLVTTSTKVLKLLKKPNSTSERKKIQQLKKKKSQLSMKNKSQLPMKKN